MKDEEKERCRKCDSEQLPHEIEILNTFYEVGAYCPSESCELFKILMVKPSLKPFNY